MLDSIDITVAKGAVEKSNVKFGNFCKSCRFQLVNVSPVAVLLYKVLFQIDWFEALVVAQAAPVAARVLVSDEGGVRIE